MSLSSHSVALELNCR